MVLKDIVSWMIQSSWFHKYNGIIGAFCAGLWFQANYWKQILATLAAWGIPPGDYTNALLMIIAASGISISIIGTIMKQKDKDNIDIKKE